MTADVELLPLPEPVAVKYPDSGLRDDEHALRLWAAHGYDTGGDPLFSAEQLREATAPLQAEIEALRAERDAAFRMSRCECASDECCANLVKHQLRAERLAEALREAKDRMLGQVKWVACDCGCEQDKPADAVSIAWLRASALLRDQEEGHE